MQDSTDLGLDETGELKRSPKRLLRRRGREIEISMADGWGEKWAQTLWKSPRKQPNRAQKTLPLRSSDPCERNPLPSSPTWSGREGEEPGAQDKMGTAQRRTLEAGSGFWNPWSPLSSSKPPSSQKEREVRWFEFTLCDVAPHLTKFLFFLFFLCGN